MKQLSKIKKLVSFAAIVLIAATICCCSSDDDSPAKRPIIDNNAGTFEVSNIANLLLVNKQQRRELEAINGDTLKVIFTPKSDYKNLKFELSCNQLTKYNDSLYIVNASDSGKQQFKLTAKYANETDTTITTYSAEKDIDITVYSESVTIPYIVTVSEDLLKFVTPEVTYENSDGERITFPITDTEWEKPQNTDNKLYSYCFNIRYTKIGIISTVTVKYLKKTEAKNDKEYYFFRHRLDRKSASVNIPGLIYNDIYVPIYISIDLTAGIHKSFVNSYISELAANPDVFKIEVDPPKTHLDRIE